MQYRGKIGFILAFVLVFVVSTILTFNVDALPSGKSEQIASNLKSTQTLVATTAETKTPNIVNPAWLQAQLDAEATAKSAAKLVSNGTVTYDVATRGSISADLAEFKTLANQTYNDSRGWARLGVAFNEVASGGDFTLVLSEASQVPTFSSGCSSEWSCRVGRYVIINQDRWLYASSAWNAGGGSLRDYRHMVINHETGHWLGHGHLSCGGVGQSAPVMQQQSIDLQGCSFNAWPLGGEIWSSQLGI